MKTFFSRIKKGLRRTVIMEKILFRDLGYILMLICIPLIIFAVQSLSKEKSGIVKIAVVNENTANQELQQALEKMVDESNTIYFYIEKNTYVAQEQLKNGEIDAVWVFPQDIEDRIANYVVGKTQDGIIIFYEDSESILLNIAREKAFEVIYSDVIYRIFSGYYTKYINAELTETELKEVYKSGLIEDNIFEYHSISGEDTTSDIENLSLVVAPVKGILAVYIFFIALMVSLILIRDRKNGAMQRLNYMEEWMYCFFFRLVAVFNVSVIVWAGLLISGGFGSGKEAAKEGGILICYAFSACAMAQLLGERINNIYLLCSISILITISSLVLCPILIPSSGIWIAKLYPVNYYLEAEGAIGMTIGLLLYGFCCFIINLLIRFVGRKKVI